MRTTALRETGPGRTSTNVPGHGEPVDRPANEPEAVDALLRQARWSVSDVSLLDLMPWHARHLEHVGIRFIHVSSESTGTVTVENFPTATGVDPLPIDLRPGEFALLPRGGVRRVRTSGGRSSILTGTLEARPVSCNRMSALMPAVLTQRIPEVPDARRSSALDLLDAEVREAGPCGSPILCPLLDVVVSTMLQAYFKDTGASADHWLSQLSDPLLTPALTAMQAAPGEPWSVESLARVARISRSAFAERFRSAMGESPARYLTRLRMGRAEEVLRAGSSVSDVAHQLGYTSEEGFRRAFRRHSGLSPSEWRRKVDAA